jgi:hypothetical protein
MSYLFSSIDEVKNHLLREFSDLKIDLEKEYKQYAEKTEESECRDSELQILFHQIYLLKWCMERVSKVGAKIETSQQIIPIKDISKEDAII